MSRSFTAKGKRTAERIHRQTIGELENENAKARTHAASFAGLVDDWLTIKERDASPSTMIAYRRHAKRIKLRFGHLPVDGLTGQMIDAWYTELMAKGMTAANVNHVHRVLRAICTFGCDDRDVMPHIPTKKAHPPQHRTPEIRPPKPMAVQAILANLPNDKEWGRAVKLLVYTGLRRGEVVGLRWDGWEGDTMRVEHSVVELPDGEVVVKDTKGKRSRVVFLNDDAVRTLAAQLEHVHARGVPTPWVFPDWTKQSRLPRRPGWVSLMWGRHRSSIGADKVRPHDLRHHYATWLLSGGIPTHTVQELLGHSTASVTLDIYGHGTDEGMALARQRLGEIGPGTPAV